jgi:hypothetical protein
MCFDNKNLINRIFYQTVKQAAINDVGTPT